MYSHGYQRFPRVMDYIQKGYIDVNAVPEKITGFGAVERWDGHLGMGNLNAKMAMQRAVELAAQLGIGMVAMSNTNHWMRGGAYGWQAAEAGCIGICWTNTCPNMPAWGAIDGRTVTKVGQGTLIRRRENLKNGIPVNEEIWKKICEL